MQVDPERSEGSVPDGQRDFVASALWVGRNYRFVLEGETLLRGPVANWVRCTAEDACRFVDTNARIDPNAEALFVHLPCVE